ncbi:unnamed protein product [Schistosoma mattheei]|uniref:Repressor of RNA polymerase III transcription MAF1 homolog n=1 Tax=Schistosoma mattheei TaxID=31246 RepID=A0A3P7Z8C1_9TREM|nr:unnamed protein product [Schistosoma mattheei]
MFRFVFSGLLKLYEITVPALLQPSENVWQGLFIRATKTGLIVALESYSCKMVSEEKRQYKELVSRLNSDENQESPALYLGSSQTLRDLYEMTGQNSSSLSPPRNVCSGRKRTRSETSICLNDSTSESPSPKFPTSALSTKDLFCLMSTLNSCFGPAYDFLTARSDEFCLEPELWVRC